MWRRLMILMAGLLCPVLGVTCELSDRHRCKDALGELIGYRSEAIEYAFGDIFGALPSTVEIRFVASSDSQFEKFSGRVAYDQSQRVLVIPRRYVDAKLPMPLRWASAYWPYYQNPKYRELFPIIEAIDNALWGAYLQEIAQTHGQSWPHKGCGSIDLTSRLPCEMLIAGIAAQLTERRELVFNTNRLDLIWPEDLARFKQRSWHPGEREYLDVQRYGGILLLRPLFSEFGVPKALAYVAQTPFRIEDDNMRVSALRYQERARQALEVMQMTPASAPGSATAITPVSTHFTRDRRFIALGNTSREDT
jgi:hypothetical protein